MNANDQPSHGSAESGYMVPGTRGSEARFRRLFEAARDGILILEPDGGTIVDVNPFLVALTGQSRDYFLGKHLWDLGSPEDVVASRTAFARLRADRYVRYEDLPLRSSDGRKIDVEFVSNVYQVDGRDEIQCNIRDITARKRAEALRETLEEQLRASQKLEAIGGLAGGVAHDFNNLLSVILNYTTFALEAPEGVSVKDDLLEVRKAAERAADLTRHLLAFSRNQVLEPVSLDLNLVATGIEKMLRRILGEDLEFVQRLAPDLALVHADPGQIEQVLMNLAVNARDAMPQGGKLTIETSNVEIDEAYAASHLGVQPGSYVQLAVTDTGCGMSAETRARIFEPFFTTKEKGKGTGLGLSTVYGIVKQSGGNVWVRSEPGHGTTFKIQLPRDTSSVSAAVPSPPLEPRAVAVGSEVILAVEDEEALRKVVRRVLEDAGYTVLTAASGEEALRTASAHPGAIDLLLADVVMPRMSGKVLAQSLVAVRPDLEVLYMSGYTDDAIVHRGVLEADTNFLGKPFTATELTRKIRAVLDDHVDPAAGRRVAARQG